jgi:hypothetical protein
MSLHSVSVAYIYTLFCKVQSYSLFVLCLFHTKYLVYFCSIFVYILCESRISTYTLCVSVSQPKLYCVVVKYLSSVPRTVRIVCIFHSIILSLK